ncbi:hypothetical protein AK88_04264 [Plasmodium fragile]|uniref:Schizont-infected cell agglutination C-terminal domain-containing protein n=1 Tax=Plasmodium fragile TaxID=5857 RepID=A0A0D9QGJ0_PLAFR|nr:uncharacterized protein AK88_04264 [Plasmodium fragile]KJP86073.1 hypothetical protein AK88_04264 [Plasmodium fragile]
MVANVEHGHSEHCEHGHIPSADMTKLRFWKEWVAQHHALMHIYGEQEWFQRLLNNVQDETVPQNGQAPIVENDLEVEKVTAAEDILSVRAVPRTQLHPQSYMQQPLTAKTCILLLALIIEECELECRLQEKELYVDALLQTCSN